MTVSTAQPSSKPMRILRRLLPWLVGALILFFIVTRVPVDAFREAMTQGPLVAIAAINVAINVALLCTDSVATWIVLVAVKMRRPFFKVVIVRGATFALFIINYAVGQGGFGYYLHRSGESAFRAVGTTLFLIGTNLAALLLITLGAWAVAGDRVTNPALFWTLVAGVIGFGLYLVIIAASPNFLSRRQVLSPLFDAGIPGHALAVLGRVPHIAVMVLGHWAAIRAWGIPVPFSVGLTVMPAVVIASALPISPSGLGTTQAAFVLFFAKYAAGATPDERNAHVLAFAIVHFVFGLLASLAVGLACLPFAKRSGVLAPPERS